MSTSIGGGGSAGSGVSGGGVSIPSLEVTGHSWGSGTGTTAAKYTLPARVASALGGRLVNLSQVGGMAADGKSGGGVAKLLQSSLVAPDLTSGPYVTPGGAKMVLYGLNEYTIYGDNAGTRALTENALRTTYAVMRAARIIYPGGSAVTADGSIGGAQDLEVAGTAGYLYAANNGQYVNVATDAAYNGEAITLLFSHTGGSACTGTWNITLNPAGANTPLGSYVGAPFDATLKATAGSYSGHRAAVLGFRIPAGTIPAGVQNIRLTAAALNGDFSNFATFAGAVIEGDAPLLVPKYPHRPGSAEPNSFSWANDRIATAATGLPNVAVVDLNTALAPNYGTANESLDNRFWYDGAHPNNVGYGLAAGLIVSAAQALVSAATAGAMNSAPVVASDVTVTPTGNIAATDAQSAIAELDTEKADAAATTSALTLKAPLASPALTGTPTVPTAAVDTNTTQAASTAYVIAQAASATPIINGTGAAGTSTRFARADHVHPTDTSRAPLASPTFTGTPAAPTASARTGTTQLATTAYTDTGDTTVPINTQTGSYTLALGDAGRCVEENSASATVITIPANATVAFPVGTVINLRRIGAGTVTITPAGGVTIPNRLEAAGTTSRTLPSQYSEASIHKRATDVWVLSGDFA